MNKIFLFWVGPQKPLDLIVSPLKEMNFEVQIGPSKEEHDFLYKKYKYYKDAYDAKIWSFCSDIWRLYKLANEKGMYMDVSCKVGQKLPELYERISKYDAWIPRVDEKVTAFCVMYSSGELTIFQEVLDFIERTYVDNIRKYWIIPNLFDYLLFVKYKEKFNIGHKLSAVHGVFLDNCKYIANKDYIFKFGFESWKKRKSNDATWFKRSYDNWGKPFYCHKIVKKEVLVKSGIFSFLKSKHHKEEM